MLVVGLVAGVLWGQRAGVFDTEPPTVLIWVPPPDAPWPPTIEVSAHDALPGVTQLSARLRDRVWELPTAGGRLTAPVDLPPGAHRLEVVAVDGSWSKNRAVEGVSLVRPPAPLPQPTTESAGP